MACAYDLLVDCGNQWTVTHLRSMLRNTESFFSIANSFRISFLQSITESCGLTNDSKLIYIDRSVCQRRQLPGTRQ